MENSISGSLGKIFNEVLPNIDRCIRQIYQAFWDGFISFVTNHWVAISSILLLFFIWALIRAFSGRWGMLGSILYNYLYFGILFILGLIKGADVFISEYFEFFCLVILYPFCYWVVGLILEKLGLRGRY